MQLADLDALAAKAGAKVKGSLVTSYHEGQDKYRERRERRYSGFFYLFFFFFCLCLASRSSLTLVLLYNTIVAFFAVVFAVGLVVGVLSTPVLCLGKGGPL